MTISNDVRVQQLLALHQATIAITSELDLDNLLQQIVDRAREVVGCQYAALGVLGNDGFIARFPTSGLSASAREQIGALPHGHGLLGVMLRAGHSLRIPDMRHDARRSGFPPHHPPMTSLLGVPIFVRGQLMGDLYLTDKIDGPEFSEADEWLVELLAAHAAIALTNAALHDQMRRAQARTEALLEVTRAISRSVELDEAMRLILESAVQLLGAGGAAIYLLDTTEGMVHQQELPAMRYAVGLNSGSVGQTVAPGSYSIAQRAIATGQTQIVPDPHADPSLILPQLSDARTVQLVIAVPLGQGRTILGALSLYFDRPGIIDAASVQLLEGFGSQATVAISNAQLYAAALVGRAVAEREGERLREVEQMKDSFLATAAHELRTPLTTIRLSAGMAREQVAQLLTALAAGDTPAVNPRLNDLLRLLEDGSSRMQLLVNNLLDLTRLEQDRVPLALADLDVRAAITVAADSVRPLLRGKDQALSVHLPEGSLWVHGDPTRLEQILVNLLANAHKYAPAGQPVEVRAGRVEGECRITVRDHGPGVPAAEQEHIFEPFYRSSLHQDGDIVGTGLGLPIARTIAHKHGGRLWVEAAPGGGSRFVLTLPLLPIP